MKTSVTIAPRREMALPTMYDRVRMDYILPVEERKAFTEKDCLLTSERV